MTEIYIQKSYTKTGMTEQLVYELPSGYSPSGSPHPLVVVWHAYGENPTAVGANSGFQAACETKNWIFAAPLCFDKRHFSSLYAHEHGILALRYMIEELALNIDTDRIYLIQHSMEGGFRHVCLCNAQGAGHYPYAGLISICPVADLSEQYDLDIYALYYLPRRLGWPKDAAHLFRYQQASPLYLVNDVYQIYYSPGRNLKNFPVWHTYSGQDTAFNRLVENQQLKALLQAAGANYHEDYHPSGSHGWGLCDPDDALDWIASYSRATYDNSDLIQILDRNTKYHWFTVERSMEGFFGYLSIKCEYSPNRLTIANADLLNDILVDMNEADLQGTAATMYLVYSETNAETQTIRMQPIDKEPTGITDGGSPFYDWSYDSLSQILTINRGPSETLDLVISWP